MQLELFSQNRVLWVKEPKLSQEENVAQFEREQEVNKH